MQWLLPFFLFFIPRRADALIFKKLNFKRHPVTPIPNYPESSQCAVVLHLFHFGQFFPISKVSASAKVIVAAIHGAGAAAAKLKIMDGFALDDFSTFFASDCVPDNFRHNQSLFSAFLIFSFSPLPSVRSRSRRIAHLSRMEFFFASRSACLLPDL